MHILLIYSEFLTYVSGYYCSKRELLRLQLRSKAAVVSNYWSVERGARAMLALCEFRRSLLVISVAVCLS